MIPVTAALLVAVTVSLAVSETVSSTIIGDSSEQMNTQIELRRGDMKFWEGDYFMNMELNAGSGDFFCVDQKIHIYQSRHEIIMYILGGWGLLMGVLIIEIYNIVREKPQKLIKKEE